MRKRLRGYSRRKPLSGPRYHDGKHCNYCTGDHRPTFLECEAFLLAYTHEDLVAATPCFAENFLIANVNTVGCPTTILQAASNLLAKATWMATFPPFMDFPPAEVFPPVSPFPPVPDFPPVPEFPPVDEFPPVSDWPTPPAWPTIPAWPVIPDWPTGTVAQWREPAWPTERPVFGKAAEQGLQSPGCGFDFHQFRLESEGKEIHKAVIVVK